MKKSVVVAMSGGVDSSVAALLLKEAGYEVIGMTLKTWPKELCDTVPKDQTCCSTRDLEDARAVAAHLGIPFYVVEAADAFRSYVIEPFVKQYARGLTPNPCVVCNRQIKCGILLNKAQALGVPWLATGHYATALWDCNRRRFVLRQGKDAAKDQSYVLFQLTQEQLSHLILPVGEKSKAEVRQLARAYNLPVAEKPESMELCFIPDGDTHRFLKARAPEAFQPGEIVNSEGRVLGRHQGIAAYTVGQRKGLGIAHPKPLYVLETDTAVNRVVVGEEEDLKTSRCEVEELHWVGVENLDRPRPAWVKVRYRSEKLAARLVPQGERVHVHFDEPVLGGVSPGQAAVFYEDDLLLGGGWIVKELGGVAQPGRAGDS